MIRQTVRDGALYAIPTILSRGMAIVLIPIYTRYLSTDEYGLLELLLVAYAFLNLLLPLEVGQGMVRHFADTDDSNEREQYFSTAFWFTSLVFGAFCLFAVLNIDFVVQTVFANTPHKQAVMVAICGMFANSLVYLMSDQLRFDMRPMAYALVSLLTVAVTVILVIVLIVNQGQGILGYAWAMLAAHFSGLVAGLLLGRWGLKLRMRFSAEHLKRMLLFSAPLVLSALAVYGNNYIDRWMILYFLGFDMLGVYSAAFRLSTGVFLVLLPLQMALTPLIYSRHNEPETPDQLSTLLDGAVLLLGCGILLIGSLIPEIYIFLVGEKFQAGAWLVPWLAISVALMNLYVFAPGMSLSKRTAVIALINLFVVMVNVTLNYLLIPMFGLWGAATATLGSGFVLLSLYLFISNRFYPIPYQSFRCLLAVIVVSSVLLLGFYFGSSWWSRLGMALVGISGLLLIFRDSLQRIIRAS